jgi:hypothetical protein
MSNEPDPTDLYPEIAGKGSLAAALEDLGHQQGLSIRMSVTESDPLRHATIASVVSHREPMWVGAYHFERRWLVSGSANNGLLVSGNTDDLGKIPLVVQAWGQDAGLEDIGRLAAFDLLTGRLEVPDGNPAGVIEAEWRSLLKGAQDAGWPEYQALIKTAYAEPRLRELCPYTSHWSLSFSATPYPFTPSFATLTAGRQGAPYDVREWWNGPTLTHVSTAEEAVAIAVARIPQDFGPRQD